MLESLGKGGVIASIRRSRRPPWKKRSLGDFLVINDLFLLSMIAGTDRE